jgi:hypothetical protein
MILHVLILRQSAICCRDFDLSSPRADTQSDRNEIRFWHPRPRSMESVDNPDSWKAIHRDHPDEIMLPCRISRAPAKNTNCRGLVSVACGCHSYFTAHMEFYNHGGLEPGARGAADSEELAIPGPVSWTGVTGVHAEEGRSRDRGGSRHSPRGGCNGRRVW